MYRRFFPSRSASCSCVQPISFRFCRSRSPNEFGTVIFQRRYMSANVLPEISDRERAYADNVKALISRGIDDGVFRPMQASVATQLVLDSINGVLRWYRPTGALNRDDAIEEIVSFVRNALTTGNA